ncbi:MAG: glycosyltransferase N-terminal domain-containing protein [Paracoccaceae bacterium]
MGGTTRETAHEERLGQATHTRPDGCLLWLHASSGHLAGPISAIAKELSHLRGEPVHALVTTSDGSPLIPSVAEATIYQTAPGETSGSHKRFFDHWHPELGVILGIPDRPKLIKAAAERDGLLYLATPERGTMTDVRRLAYTPGAVLERFKTCFAASTVEADALERHLEGKPLKIEVLGPLSDTSHALACHDADCDALATQIAGRPVWLAAGITRAEIAFIEEAHRKAFRSAHRLMLILVPQDLEDAGLMSDILESKGWSTALRSQTEKIDIDTQVLIADVPDEMGIWYRLAPTTFVGGTFDAHSEAGDPYDPAALGSAVLHGPHTGDTPARFERLAQANASLLIEDSEALGVAIQSLLSPDKAAVLAQAGWATTTESAEVIERMVELMDMHLDAQEAALSGSST